jgi:uncharacterized protein YdeI (YjbR/CyaY-like superfamily)
MHLVDEAIDKSKLTWSSLLRLFSRQSEGGNQFHQYLHHHFRHRWCGRDPGINVKSVEEIPDALEQVFEDIEAVTDVLDRLVTRNLDGGIEHNV